MKNLSLLDQVFIDYLSAGCLFTALGVVELSGLTNDPILICMLCILTIPFIIFTILRIKNRSKERDEDIDRILDCTTIATTYGFFLILEIGILCLLCSPTYRYSTVNTIGILFFLIGIYKLLCASIYFICKYFACNKLEG